MEYLQCGQCDRGVMMLMPDGSRWMHTFKKLPTMQPNTKKTSDQKWKGTIAQLCGLKIALIPINKTQNRPHPDPLPPGGRGNGNVQCLELLTVPESPTDWRQFTLSHRMGEGRGEGKIWLAHLSAITFCHYHKRFLRALSASRRLARIRLSRFQMPSRPDAAACPDHSRFCSRRLSRP